MCTVDIFIPPWSTLQHVHGLEPKLPLETVSGTPLNMFSRLAELSRCIIGKGSHGGWFGLTLHELRGQPDASHEPCRAWSPSLPSSLRSRRHEEDPPKINHCGFTIVPTNRYDKNRIAPEVLVWGGNGAPAGRWSSMRGSKSHSFRTFHLACLR